MTGVAVGASAPLSERLVHELRRDLRGPLLESADPGYETRDGRLVWNAEDEPPELLWGLRGGGGNFGIVTEFEYRVHPVGVVQTATLMWPAEQGRDVLRLYREFSSTEPEDLTTFLFFLGAPAGPFLPSKLHERIVGSYGSEIYHRLEALKSKYDPANFFASNQNIRPASG